MVLCNNRIEHHREEQGVPGCGNSREAEQQYNNGGKGDDHYRVVERHLGQGEMRFLIAQVAPNEHHRSAGGSDEPLPLIQPMVC